MNGNSLGQPQQPPQVLPEEVKGVFEHLQRTLSECKLTVSEHQNAANALLGLKNWTNQQLLELQKLQEAARASAPVDAEIIPPGRAKEAFAAR